MHISSKRLINKFCGPWLRPLCCTDATQLIFFGILEFFFLTQTKILDILFDFDFKLLFLPCTYKITK